jgi:hypothetical protein
VLDAVRMISSTYNKKIDHVGAATEDKKRSV